MTAQGIKEQQGAELLAKLHCVDLIQSLYTPLVSSSGDSGWSDCLCKLCKSLGSSTAGLVSYDILVDQSALQHEFGIGGKRSKKRNEWLSSIHPWLKHLASYRSADVVTEHDLRTWRQSTFLDSSVRASRPMLFGVIERQATSINALCLTKQPGKRSFDEEQKSAIAELLPHMRSMLSIYSQLIHLRTQIAFFADTFFNLPIAALLVEGTGRVRYQNHMAEEILARNDELFIDELGFIEASSRRVRHRLRCLIKAIANNREETRNSFQRPAQHLVIKRTEQEIPLMCILNPVPQKSLSGKFETDTLVALFIQDPLLRKFPGLEDLAESFKMTKAETRVVELILNGQGLFEVANELGITHNTARTHMRHIYAKVGTHRQADLVRIFGSFFS